MKNDNLVLFIAIVLVQIITIITIERSFDSVHEELSNTNRNIEHFLYFTERLQMYDINIPEKVIVNGVYHSKGDFYCVWTGNRTDEAIKETDEHELCHAYIDIEEEHFCGWSND